MSRQKRNLFVRAAVMAMVVAAASGATTTAMAQSADADRQISVSIPSQSLSDALRQLAETSGLQLVYDARITDGRTAPAVSGTMTARSALASLLAGSGLSVQFSGDRTAIITGATTAAVAEDGVRAVGVVNVEGAAGFMPSSGLVSPVNGINGSRDVQATEGTGSYTTGAVSIASKTPQTLRETPASVSVMTAQQIEDQSLVTLRDILEKTAGLTITSGASSSEFRINSRGFRITTYTIDGGASIDFDNNNRPVLDMSEFDSVQLVRGADGMFGGYGNPGGVVNLVRKKPLDFRQLVFTQDVGSWSNFREELDLTGPLSADKRLRGRVTASRTDREYFYDVVESHRTSVYGVIDYSLGASTLATIGGNYIRENNTPSAGGLPRFLNGDQLDFPRSTCLCVPYNSERAIRQEAFVTLDHKFNNNLSTRLNVTYNRQDVEGTYFNFTTRVFQNGTSSAALGGSFTRNPSRQLTVDLSNSGNFTLLGRNHSVVAGGSYQYINADGGYTRPYVTRSITNLFPLNLSNFPQPPLPPIFTKAVEYRAQIYGAYTNFNFEILDNLHVSVGLRYSSFLDGGINFQAAFSGTGPGTTAPVNETREQSFSKPNFGITYDFLDNFTLYGSYQSIYRPQTVRNVIGEETPPPITGMNQETGIKWQSPDNRLNASLSYYSTTQENFLQRSPQDFTQYRSSLTDLKSEGVDFEVAGEVYPNVQVSFSYSYNDNESSVGSYTRAGVVTDVVTVAPVSSFTPHHIVKAWASYRGAPGTRFSRFMIGAGVKMESDSFTAGRACPSIILVPRTGCPVAEVPYEFTSDGFTTYSLKLGYDVTDRVEISISGDNLTDVKAFESAPFRSNTGFNNYIQPANVLVSLRAKW